MILKRGLLSTLILEVYKYDYQTMCEYTMVSKLGFRINIPIKSRLPPKFSLSGITFFGMVSLLLKKRQLSVSLYELIFPQSILGLTCLAAYESMEDRTNVVKSFNNFDGSEILKLKRCGWFADISTLSILTT